MVIIDMLCSSVHATCSLCVITGDQWLKLLLFSTLRSRVTAPMVLPELVPVM